MICGSGRSLFPDLQHVVELNYTFKPGHVPDTAPAIRIDNIHEHFDIMAINDAFLALPVAHYLASYHSELIWPWMMLRGPLESINGEYKTQWRGVSYSQRADKGVKKVHVFEHGSGTSSFYGVQIGLAEGWNRVILCGIPMDMKGRFYQPPWVTGHDYCATDGWDAWTGAKERGELENVRSMSGKTAELLGIPEREWLWPSSRDSMV